MVTNLKGTLWDAIEGHEAEVAEAVHGAVVKAAEGLGGAIQQLDWHNIAASAESSQESQKKAA